jgi:hypothetical protein
MNNGHGYKKRFVVQNKLNLLQMSFLSLTREHYNYLQLIQIVDYLQNILKVPGLIKLGLSWEEKRNLKANLKK